MTSLTGLVVLGVTVQPSLGDIMPLDLTPIPASNKSRTALADIDPDVVTAVEEAYKYCADTTERLQANLGSKEAAEKFLHDARGYAYQREAGRVIVIGNPTAAGLVRFRVEDYVAPTDGEAVGTTDGK